MILLGAGASRPLGVPTMAEFTDLALSRLEGDPKKLCSELNERLSAWGKSLGLPADLESLLQALLVISDRSNINSSWPQLAALADEIPQWDKRKSEVAKQAKDEIEKFIIETCLKIDLDKAAAQYYELFTSLPGKVLVNREEKPSLHGSVPAEKGKVIRTCDLFTTNYDLGFESFLDRYNLPFEDGFGVQARSSYPSYQGIWNAVTNGFNLVKLHGSIDYYKREDGTIVKLPFHGEEDYLGHKFKGQVMIFPVGEKHATREPYYGQLQYLRESLHRDPLVLILGSSLRDEPILNIIDDVVSKKETKAKIVLVAGEPKKIAERFSKATQSKTTCFDARLGSPGFCNELGRRIVEHNEGELIKYPA